MQGDDEEYFVSVCVKYFDQINDKTTIRGTPGSTKNLNRQKQMDDAWLGIQKEMNELCGVSQFVRI